MCIRDGIPQVSLREHFYSSIAVGDTRSLPFTRVSLDVSISDRLVLPRVPDRNTVDVKLKFKKRIVSLKTKHNYSRRRGVRHFYCCRG